MDGAMKHSLGTVMSGAISYLIISHTWVSMDNAMMYCLRTIVSELHGLSHTLSYLCMHNLVHKGQNAPK